jgi:hypothetical protein
MANTLTDLIPTVYSALDVVSRELVGFIPAVTMDATTERAAVGQTVRLPVAPAVSATDITPGVTPPNDGDQTIGNRSLTIDKARRVPIRWNGEEQRGINNGGPGVNTILQNQFAQGIRTLCNEIEADLAALHITTSRAYGTAGTTPFGTVNDYTDATFANKILSDNGAPLDRQLVINTAAGATMKGKQSAVDAAGTDSILRQGILLDIDGVQIRESGQVANFIKGTATSATVNNAGYAVGATVLTLSSAGTGAILAGDVVTFAGDTNQYVVTSGDADVSGGGTITIAEPGLRVAMSTATKAITVVGNSARNMIFSRSALILAARAPALPAGGDLAVDRTLIQDPRSGLTFELAMYPQYRQMQYELSIAWGVANAAPRHSALLLG